MSKIIQIITGQYSDDDGNSYSLFGLDNDGSLYKYDFDSDEWEYKNGGEGVLEDIK